MVTFTSLAVGAAVTFGVSRLMFDSYYFIRFIWTVGSTVAKQMLFKEYYSLTDEHVLSVRCTTTDLDHMMHMNNSRYLREADFSRTYLLVRNGFYWAAWSQLGTTPALSATTIRYRRSINFGDRALLRAKIVYWDDRSFYVEQKFESQPSGFIAATMYAKLTLTGVTTEQMLKCLQYSGTKPEPSDDLKTWLTFIEQSSQRLRPKAQ